MQKVHEPVPALDNARVLVFPPLLLALCAGTAALTSWAIPSSGLRAIIAYPMAGLFAMAGLCLERWAQHSLRRANTTVHPSGSTRDVVSTGAFAWSRNPIYLAQGLLLVAVCCLLRSIAGFWVLLPWFLVMRVGVIAREERYLLGKFGPRYEAYLGKVRRWI